MVIQVCDDKTITPENCSYLMNYLYCMNSGSCEQKRILKNGVLIEELPKGSMLEPESTL